MKNNLQFLHTDEILQAICQLIKLQSTSDHELFQSTLTEDQIEHLFQQLILSETSEPFYSLIHSKNSDIAKYGCFKILELLNPFHQLIDQAFKRLEQFDGLSSLEFSVIKSLKQEIAEARIQLITSNSGSFYVED